MALIKCEECDKEISDTVKTCPHCGYKLKKSKNINNIKFDFYNSNVLSCFLLLLSFIASFFEISFSRDNYSTDRQLLNYSFNDIMYQFIDNLDGIYVIVGIVAIIALVYTIIKKKLKLKKIYYYIPLFLYNLIAIIISCAVTFGLFNEHASRYDTYYRILWGGIWILIMLCFASVILIIDLIKSKKEKLKQ